MSKEQQQIETLLNTLDVLLKEFKLKEENDKVVEDLLKQAMDANTLYCRFINEHYQIDTEELAKAFDSWVASYSDEELEEICKEAIEEPKHDPKIDAETPDVLYSLDDLLNELNIEPEEGA